MVLGLLNVENAKKNKHIATNILPNIFPNTDETACCMAFVFDMTASGPLIAA